MRRLICACVVKTGFLALRPNFEGTTAVNQNDNAGSIVGGGLCLINYNRSIVVLQILRSTFLGRFRSTKYRT